MGFVKAVPCEELYEIENLICLFLGDLPLGCARNELFALGFHHSRILLAHRLA